MVTTFLSILVLLLLVVLGVQAALWRTLAAGRVDLSPLAGRIESVERAQERAERGLREEIARGRDDAAREAREFRAEIADTVKKGNDSLVSSLAAVSANQSAELARMTETTAQRLNEIREAVRQRLEALQEENARVRDHAARDAREFRAELAETVKKGNDSLVNGLAAVSANQSAELARMTETTAQRLDSVRDAVQQRLQTLQEENAAKLEQIRRTVDEQLQSTLEKRLGESFQIVSDRLEQVHRGLGEMQTLASGVGDLKKLLANVRTRGTWGEAQLGMMLEQMLTAEQYALNVACTGTAERVEFAIKLPGPDRDGYIWLPVDAKFPREDYERLLDAVDRADAPAVEACSRDLETRVRQCAREIAQKYIAPPATTDFAILYLPTEGLYAETLRRPGLIEAIQREHHVTIAGPTTLAAILNSLQMGFRTLAIQKRSSEVWEVLGKVKTEFGKYADVLAKVQKKLQEASNTVDEGLKRTRVLNRRLDAAQQLTAPSELLGEEESEFDAIAADIRG